MKSKFTVRVTDKMLVSVERVSGKKPGALMVIEEGDIQVEISMTPGARAKLLAALGGFNP